MTTTLRAPPESDGRTTSGRLELHGITAGYGSTTVLRDLSLVVPPHSIVALLGANGAGKTTVLNVASGLIAPSHGTVLLDGRDVTGWTTSRRAEAGICLIPEGRGIFPNLTVRENLLLQERPGSETPAIDLAVAAFPVLGRRLGQAAGTMSGGEQQMVALARAYVCEPRVVLLDEVSMGLAPKVVDEIFDFIDQLAKRGTALLLVEQYITRALEMAHYVYLLHRGAVAFAGQPCELEDNAVFGSYVGS